MLRHWGACEPHKTPHSHPFSYSSLAVATSQYLPSCPLSVLAKINEFFLTLKLPKLVIIYFSSWLCKSYVIVF